MDITEAIKARRSIRTYLPGLVDIETVKELVSAGQEAPSACNIQGWRYIFIDNKETLLEIKKRGGAPFLDQAPCALLALYNNRSDNVEYRDYIQSGAASIQNIILKAWSLNIGTCWTCHLPAKRELRKMFKIPGHYDPIALIALGRYAKTPPAPKKPAVDEILCRDSFSFDEASPPAIPFKLYIRRLIRKVYYFLPCRWILDKYVARFIKKF